MSRTKRSPAAVREKARAIPTNLFDAGAEHEPLPTSADRIADVRRELYRDDHEHTDGEFWKFDCDMRAVIAQLFASFANDIVLTEGNLHFTGKTPASRKVIKKATPKALRLEAQRRHTELATLLFALRVGDAVKWAVEFVREWAQTSVRVGLSEGYVAVSGKGFQATGKLASQTAAKAAWRDHFREHALEFIEPFVQKFHGKPGATSKLDRDIAAREHHDRRLNELMPSKGMQKAMEIAKKETMTAFDLKTTKTYHNAMRRGGAHQTGTAAGDGG